MQIQHALWRVPCTFQKQRERLYRQVDTLSRLIHVHIVENDQVTANLTSCVEQSVDQYLRILDNPEIANLYELVLEQIEEPLLKRVLKYVRSNQVRAAKLLGISRGTLRKKMKRYGML